MARPTVPTLIAMSLIAACGQRVDGPGSVPTAGAPPSSVEASRRGEILALTCRACHTFGPGEGHQVGPNLSGIFGREAASAPGFEYSAALAAAGFVWTPEKLDAWLAEPNGFLPGNNMPFAGFNSASDRRDLIAYLLRITADGVP